MAFLTIVFTRTNNVILITALNKPIAEAYENSRILPDCVVLYTYVESTSDTDKFLGLCIKSAFSAPTEMILVQHNSLQYYLQQRDWQ